MTWNGSTTVLGGAPHPDRSGSGVAAPTRNASRARRRSSHGERLTKTSKDAAAELLMLHLLHGRALAHARPSAFFGRSSAPFDFKYSARSSNP